MNVDAGTLESANVEVNNSGFFGTFVMVPVVDGELIVERPIVTIERGTLNAVSLPVRERTVSIRLILRRRTHS